MSDCFDHMYEALDSRLDDCYREDRVQYFYAPATPRCRICKELISFHGKVPWDDKKNQRHECDFSKLLEVS